MAFNDPAAVVKGLEEFPREDHPSKTVQLFFQIMVGAGTAMAALSAWTVLRWLRKREPASSRVFLKAVVLAGPLGFVATEAGWMVTELGRQPWVIYGVLRTSHAATTMPNMVVPFVTFALVYALLGWVTGAVLWKQIRATLRGEDESVLALAKPAPKLEKREDREPGS